MALHDLLVPSFAEVGKIKIGGKAPPKPGKTWRMPEKWDHFQITTLVRNQNDDLTPDTALMDSLGEFKSKDGKLRSIPVMFASNDITQIMTTNYVWYIGKKLAAKSDGRQLELRHNPDTGEALRQPHFEDWDKSWLDRQDPTYKQGPKPLFKLSTRLNVMIASPQARFGGFYAFRTTSVISANQLYGSLLMLRRFTGGVLRGMPFRMVVRPLLVTPGGVTSTVYVVHVEYMNSDLVALQGAARQQAAFELENATAVAETEKQYKILLATTGEEPLDEDEDDLDNAPIAALPPASPPPPPPPPAVSLADKTRFELVETLTAMEDLKAFHAFWSSETFAKELWPKLSKDGKAEIQQLGEATAARLKNPPPAEGPPPVSAGAGTEESGPAPVEDEKGPDPIQKDAAPPTTSETNAPTANASPASVGEPPQKPAKAGKHIVDKIEKAIVARGTTWADFRVENQIEASRPKDLDADDAIRVLKILTLSEGTS